MQFIGELAALSTSGVFVMTALIFTQTGRMVGSQVTNRMRLLFALIYLVAINLILFREPLRFSAGPCHSYARRGRSCLGLDAV